MTSLSMVSRMTHSSESPCVWPSYGLASRLWSTVSWTSSGGATLIDSSWMLPSRKSSGLARANNSPDYRTPTRNSSFQMAQGCQHRHQSVILVSRSMRSSRWMHRSCHAADLVTIICVESDRCVISSVRPHCVPSWWHSYSAGSTTVTVSTRAARKLSCKDFRGYRMPQPD